MPEKAKYNGVTIYMDGRDWVVPPLSVRQFRENYDTLTKIDEITPENWQESVESRLPIILLAMQRNYPELTLSQLEDMLDINSFTAAVTAVSTGSGLVPAKPGE